MKGNDHVHTLEIQAMQAQLNLWSKHTFA